MSERYSALGLLIEEIKIRGEEFDSDVNRVSADTIVRAADASHWLLSLVTKQHFLNTEIHEVFEEIDDPSTHVAALTEGLDKQLPYVLNDRAITDEVLHKKFIGREIGEDLAAAMVFYDPERSH